MVPKKVTFQISNLPNYIEVPRGSPERPQPGGRIVGLRSKPRILVPKSGSKHGEERNINFEKLQKITKLLPLSPTLITKSAQRLLNDQQPQTTSQTST